MKRETLTKKLERIIRTIESGETPVPVRNLWVYGSYARGALDCGDLDLAIVVDRPTEQWYAENLDLPEWDYKRFEQLVKNSLKKRGERIDIFFETKEDFVLNFFKRVPINDAILLWSENHSDWRNTLESIKPDPNAGRFHRPYPIDLKRTGSTRLVMEDVLELVEKQCLKMTILDMCGFQPNLTSNQQRRLESLRQNGRIGKATLEVLPYGFDWFNREQQRVAWYTRSSATLINETATYKVHLGKIDFGYALNWLYHDGKKKLCLIPHIRKRKKNELFVIERGSRWTAMSRKLSAG